MRESGCAARAARRLRATPAVLAGAAMIALLAVGPPLATRAQAQARRGGDLVCRVVNKQTREPIAGVHVQLVGTRVAAFTDSSGTIAMRGLPSGTPISFQARAVGFRMASFEITLPTGTQVERVLELDPQAVALDTVTVAAAPSNNWRSNDAFESRRNRGIGYFITKEMIDERQANILRDLLVVVPGVFTTCRGPGGTCQVQMMASGKNCTPEWFLDGFPATQAVGPDFPIQRIRNVEVYRSIFEVPPEFQRSTLRCGVIAVWSNMER
ncbi:MAG: TonB-dependent receptor [Gemmatimonadales bacterium]|jgi:hypothetical protein